MPPNRKRSFYKIGFLLESLYKSLPGKLTCLVWFLIRHDRSVNNNPRLPWFSHKPIRTPALFFTGLSFNRISGDFLKLLMRSCVGISLSVNRFFVKILVTFSSCFLDDWRYLVEYILSSYSVKYISWLIYIDTASFTMIVLVICDDYLFYLECIFLCNNQNPTKVRLKREPKCTFRWCCFLFICITLFLCLSRVLHVLVCVLSEFLS